MSNRIPDYIEKDRQRSRDAKNIVHVIPEMQPTEQTLRPSINSESVRMAFHSLSLFLFFLSLSFSLFSLYYLSIHLYIHGKFCWILAQHNGRTIVSRVNEAKSRSAYSQLGATIVFTIIYCPLAALCSRYVKHGTKRT